MIYDKIMGRFLKISKLPTPWKYSRMRFNKYPCPPVLHFKPKGVGTFHKIISSSLQEKSILELAFENELIQEPILTILCTVLRYGRRNHGLVIIFCGWRVKIVRLEGGDQGGIILLQAVQVWPVKYFDTDH